MPKLQATHYRQDEVVAVEYEMWAPGDEEYHHPSQRVVEGPPRQAGHTRHLQHHGVSTVL